MMRLIKPLGALLLLLCFALPMSSCTQHLDATEHMVAAAPDGTYPSGTHTVITHSYLTDKIKAADPISWLFVAAFIWPTIFLLNAKYRPMSRITNLLWFIEPLLLGGTGFMIYGASIFADRVEIGSYIGWAGIVVYCSGWTHEAATRWRNRQHE